MNDEPSSLVIANETGHTIMKADVDKAARELIGEYKKIWPGTWPAMSEARRLVAATMVGLGVFGADELLNDLRDVTQKVENC